MSSRPIGQRREASPLTGLTAGVGSSRNAKTRSDKARNDSAHSAHNAPVKVSLSEQGKRLREDKAKAFDIAKSTSPVREDRVAELKKRIQSGQYEINAGKIADGMLNEAIKESLAQST